MPHQNLKLLAERGKLILGSRSPRRVALLNEIGIAYTQIIPSVEERRSDGEQPSAYAVRLATAKAEAVAADLEPGHFVIGCDTIVILDDQVLEKPGDRQAAHETLRSLSGKLHTVCSAVAIVAVSGPVVAGYELTEVKFNELTDDQIESYIATGEPMDKAGAYGIQGMGAFLVDSIRGNLDTVVGLPRTLLNKLAGKVLNDN